MINIATDLQKIEQQTATATARAERDSNKIRLLPVSKTKPLKVVLEICTAGYWRFGENEVQETRNKRGVLRGMTDIEWVVIGHLQSSKAKYVARLTIELQVLDSLKVASELDHRLQQKGRRLEVLVQVNSLDENQKFGLPSQGVVTSAKQLNAFGALDVRGLMTPALFTDDTECITRCSKMIRQVQQELRDVTGEDWDELSMGMSSDSELVIEHGTTRVRIDQAIFENCLDPNTYWSGTK